MRRLHPVLTAGLVATVVVLSVLLFRQGRRESEPPPPAPADTGRRIERVPDAELALKQLGYTAWVFRWSGGMIDGEFRTDSSSPPRGFGGVGLYRQLRAMAQVDGGNPPGLDSMRGMLVVQLGPHDRWARPPVPGRVVISAETGSKPDRRTSCDQEVGGPLQVAFAADGAESELAIEVYAKWRTSPGGTFSRDLNSNYSLLKLRWLEDAGK